jgi:hypothetical protein
VFHSPAFRAGANDTTGSSRQETTGPSANSTLTSPAPRPSSQRKDTPDGKRNPLRSLSNPQQQFLNNRPRPSGGARPQQVSGPGQHSPNTTGTTVGSGGAPYASMWSPRSVPSMALSAQKPSTTGTPVANSTPNGGRGSAQKQPPSSRRPRNQTHYDATNLSGVSTVSGASDASGGAVLFPPSEMRRSKTTSVLMPLDGETSPARTGTGLWASTPRDVEEFNAMRRRAAMGGGAQRVLVVKPHPSEVSSFATDTIDTSVEVTPPRRQRKAASGTAATPKIDDEQYVAHRGTVERRRLANHPMYVKESRALTRKPQPSALAGQSASGKPRWQ